MYMWHLCRAVQLVLPDAFGVLLMGLISVIPLDVPQDIRTFQHQKHAINVLPIVIHATQTMEVAFAILMAALLAMVSLLQIHVELAIHNVPPMFV